MSEKLNKEYPNIPPKEIQNAIWMALEYKDFIKPVSRKKNSSLVIDAVYNTWQIIHKIAKDEPEWFMKWIQEHKPDLSPFGEEYEE